MILDEIIKSKREEVELNKRNISFSHLDRAIAARTKYFSFKKALTKTAKVSIIAEIKKASPSKGVIRENFNPVEIAKIYEENGASAISVLTDRKFFQGDIEFLSDIREVVAIPLLRKDFIIDEYQIFESAAFGADAILLIAAVLSVDEMKTFLLKAEQLKMNCLVEIHNEDELKKVLKVDPDIIGINNRNLNNFEVNITNTDKLMENIPQDKIIVSESGIHTPQDMNYLKELGIHAALIGESFMREKDIGAKLKDFLEES